MNPIETSPPPKQRKKNLISPLKKLVESRDLRDADVDEYRQSTRKLYDGPAGAMLMLGSRLSLHEPLAGHLLRSRKFDVSGFRHILDVGSGAGQILAHLVKVVHEEARIVAFDLSPEMLKRARQRVKGDRPQYVAGDLMRMPFADNTFDCITCGWVLEHLPDPAPGLQEMERVLQPGGSLLLMVSEDTFLGAIVSYTWKCRTYNRQELQAACEAAGLPWKEQLWFTPLHRLFKMGGILVEATKPAAV